MKRTELDLACILGKMGRPVASEYNKQLGIMFAQAVSACGCVLARARALASIAFFFLNKYKSCLGPFHGANLSFPMHCIPQRRGHPPGVPCVWSCWRMRALSLTVRGVC